MQVFKIFGVKRINVTGNELQIYQEKHCRVP